MGSRTVKVVPGPGPALGRRRCRRVRGTIALTIESPSPAPPWIRERRRVRAVEALEDVRGLLRRSSRGRCRRRRSPHPSVLAAHRDLAVVPGGVWARTLPEQVVDDLSEAGGVTHHLDRLGGDSKVSGHSGPTVDAVCTASAQSATRSTERSSSGRPSSSRASSSRSATRCSILPGLAADPPHHPLEVLFLLGRAPSEELCVGRDRRDRRAQLVRGVRDELPESRFGRPEAPLRGESGSERGLDPGEHHVEGPRQPADLGVVVLAGHPLGEVALGDRAPPERSISRSGRSPRRTSQKPPSRATMIAPRRSRRAR